MCEGVPFKGAVPADVDQTACAGNRPDKQKISGAKHVMQTARQPGRMQRNIWSPVRRVWCLYIQHRQRYIPLLAFQED